MLNIICGVCVALPQLICPPFYLQTAIGAVGGEGGVVMDADSVLEKIKTKVSIVKQVQCTYACNCHFIPRGND